jgi:hypothetical protein
MSRMNGIRTLRGMPSVAAALCVLFLALLPSHTRAQVGDGHALTFRGYRLGITLSDFRKLPYADEVEYDATLICTGDALAARPEVQASLGLGVVAEEAKLGVTVCRYFYRVPKAENWTEAGIAIGDLGRRPTSFYFMPRTDDPEFSERLFRIILTFNYSQSVRLMGTYLTELGPPQEILVGGIESDTGNFYDSSLATWRISTVELKVANRVGQEVGSATYSDLHLAQWLSDREFTDHPGETDSEP